MLRWPGPSLGAGRDHGIDARSLGCRKRAGRRHLLHAVAPLASAYCLAGRPDAALDEEAIEQAQALGDPFGHWLRAGGQAEAYLRSGRAAEALPLARSAVDLTRAIKARGLLVLALCLMGEVAASQEPSLAEESESAYNQALSMAREMGMRPLEARCRLGLGVLYGGLGRDGDASAELAAAREAFGTLEMPFWAGEVGGRSDPPRPLNLTRAAPKKE